MAAQQIFEFPAFGSLPEHIRKDIWERAVRKVITGPSIQFLNLTRDDVDTMEEDRLISEAGEKALADALPNWDQLTRDEKVYILQGAQNTALWEYRTSLVNLTPSRDRTGLAQYSARWQLNELAATCTEAQSSTERALEMSEKNGPYRMTEDDPNAVAPFRPPGHIVCLAGPEKDACAGMPFFADDMEDMGLPQRQVLFVTTPEFRQNPFGDQPLDLNMFFHLGGRNSTTRCFPLSGLLELRGVQRLAFIYREQDDPILYRFPFLVGLAALWPQNLPWLRELYLIDASISLRAGIEAPPPSTPRFEGCGATFYEVIPADMDLWDIPKAQDSPFAAVFVDVDELQQAYVVHEEQGYYAPAVKVLACVPDTRSQ